MIIALPVTGIITTVAYLYIDDGTRIGFLIDPGAEADKILSVIKSKELKIEKILLTHGHFDHIGAADELRRELSAPVFMHENGRAYAENPQWNLSESTGSPVVLTDARYLSDGSKIPLAANPTFALEMRHVPGHTTDSVFYYDGGAAVAFVGDTIFQNSFGATHYYGGNAQTIMQSISRRILTLPEDTLLLSAHSEPTTVREERSRPYYAPFI